MLIIAPPCHLVLSYLVIKAEIWNQVSMLLQINDSMVNNIGRLVLIHCIKKQGGVCQRFLCWGETHVHILWLSACLLQCVRLCF